MTAIFSKPPEGPGFLSELASLLQKHFHPPKKLSDWAKAGVAAALNGGVIALVTVWNDNDYFSHPFEWATVVYLKNQFLAGVIGGFVLYFKKAPPSPSLLISDPSAEQ